MSEKRPYWFPVKIDAEYFARLRRDYPENAHLPDDDLKEYFCEDSDKYADVWDHVGDARRDWQELADWALDAIAVLKTFSGDDAVDSLLDRIGEENRPLAALEKAVGVWNGKAVHRGKECTRLRRERDEARREYREIQEQENNYTEKIAGLAAKNERLEGEKDLACSVVSQMQDVITDLRAENERLKVARRRQDRLAKLVAAKNERLRAVVEAAKDLKECYEEFDEYPTSDNHPLYALRTALAAAEREG